ncbi:MAG TPA: iron-containing alcohol dehydrogenase [Candidatus Acidoferrales bacterium]|nr:iron-containing alcohol dehydrogenase [Candidatus Acidoferrales bacterium]
MNSVLTTFNFYFNTQVTFGAGCRAELPALLERNGWRRVGLVVDHNLRAVERVAKLIAASEAVAERVVVGWCAIAEPTYDALEAARGQFADHGLQAVAGIGGGSALDMAKAMAVLVHNREPAIHYRGFDRMTEPVLPIIAVPTTAGTGSEVTPNASFIDTREQRKMGINGESVRPRYALLDPELTLSCPLRASVSTGVDSMVHATEAYVAKKTNPPARLFAREGFRRVFNALPSVADAPDNLALRSEVMYGAFLAGVALMNSGTGPAAAMSYPLGVRYGVPHGIGGGIFLPSVARHNVAHGVTDYAELYQVMDGALPELSRHRQAEQYVERLMHAWQRMGVPNDLTALGVSADGIDDFVKETLDLQGALDQNPVPFYADEIRATLRILMGRPA